MSRLGTRLAQVEKRAGTRHSAGVHFVTVESNAEAVKITQSMVKHGEARASDMFFVTVYEPQPARATI